MTTARLDTTAVDAYLATLLDRNGTDLHLSAGARPLGRFDGHLEPLDVSHPPLTTSQIGELVLTLLGPTSRQRFADDKTVDFSFDWRDRCRFRANAFLQRGSVSLVLRRIPFEIPTLEQLELPGACHSLVRLDQGLVLVAGPTGSGKSTTIAAMIGWINANRALHVLTIEDPIEYVHRHLRSLVNQRQLGEDVDSFPEALRAALREDPDVVLIGEMRDLETMAAALTIAETGHLVFATVHANDSTQAVDRIIDAFPGGQQNQARLQLANSLEAVLYQRLLPANGGGRIAAFEVLLATGAVRNLIVEGQTRQLRNQLTLGQQVGMQTFELGMARLIAEGRITPVTAATNERPRLVG